MQAVPRCPARAAGGNEQAGSVCRHRQLAGKAPGLICRIRFGAVAHATASIFVRMGIRIKQYQSQKQKHVQQIFSKIRNFRWICDAHAFFNCLIIRLILKIAAALSAETMSNIRYFLLCRFSAHVPFGRGSLFNFTILKGIRYLQLACARRSGHLNPEICCAFIYTAVHVLYI